MFNNDDSSSSSSAHPLYKAAALLIQQGMSPRQMTKLAKALARNGLPIPVDLEMKMVEAGLMVPAINTVTDEDDE